MKNMQQTKKLTLGLALLALSGLTACNISSSNAQVGGGTNGSGGGVGGGNGLVVTFTDTTQITIHFNDITKTVFADSEVFDLLDIRQKLRDNEMDSSTVSITNLSASFDNSTLAFLTSNSGKAYVFQVFTRDPATTALAKLTLESSSSPSAILTFDPANPPMELNNQLFGNAAGFSDLVRAIQGTSASIQAKAEMTLVPGPLADTGTVDVNLVITVSGKKKI